MKGIYIVNNIVNKKIFIDILTKLQKKELNKVKLSLDYEYNYRKIGLCQVMINSKEVNKIFLFIPSYFSNREQQLIKDTIYLSKYKKILHGSESLDIPYIYGMLGNKKDIIKFTSKMYDTRFMCDQVKLLGQKCSLYEGLVNTKTITKDDYDNLMKIYNRNPNLYKLHWNVNNMPKDAYLYAAFDVLYLKKFYKNLTKYPENLIINDISRLIFLERNNITHIIKNNSVNKKLVEKYKKSNLLGIKIDYFRNYIIQIYAICKQDKKVITDISDLELKKLANYLSEIV